jgi:beta-galactosidase
MVFSDGTTGTMPSIHCPAWRRDAAVYLTTLVKHLEEKYPGNMIGYHPCGQETAEWFYSQFWEGKTPGFEAAALTAFRAWLKTRYASDEELRKAWHDETATLGEATVPTAAQCASVTTDGCFRDPAIERKVTDFFAFQNEAMADVAADFCRVVKEHAPRKLTVTFYGYPFELSAAPHGIQSSGHLALRRILESPHVDALCGPVSYLNRLGGGGGYYMGPADSLALHGKLWLVEDDTRTYHAKPPSPEIAALVDPNGAWKLLITRDARETRGVLSRNFAHFFTHGHAAWWMDLLGEGWYDDPEIWQQLGKLHAFYQQSMTRRQPYQPEIAVIMDEVSNLDHQPVARAHQPVVRHEPLGMVSHRRTGRILADERPRRWQGAAREVLHHGQRLPPERRAARGNQAPHAGGLHHPLDLRAGGDPRQSPRSAARRTSHRHERGRHRQRWRYHFRRSAEVSTRPRPAQSGF